MKRKTIISIIILLSLLAFSACTKSSDSTSGTSSGDSSVTSKINAASSEPEESSDSESSVYIGDSTNYDDAVAKGYIKDGTHRVTLEQIRELIDKYHDGKKVLEEVGKIQPIWDSEDAFYDSFDVFNYIVDKENNYWVSFKRSIGTGNISIVLVRGVRGNSEILHKDNDVKSSNIESTESTVSE